MSLASEMARAAAEVRNSDKVLARIWDTAMNEIQKRVNEGKNEAVLSWMLTEIGDWQYRDRLIQKLTDEGFRVRKGMEIGKGMSSWETEFVLW